jgi:hypothetical protein
MCVARKKILIDNLWVTDFTRGKPIPSRSQADDLGEIEPWQFTEKMV